ARAQTLKLPSTAYATTKARRLRHSRAHMLQHNNATMLSQFTPDAAAAAAYGMIHHQSTAGISPSLPPQVHPAHLSAFAASAAHPHFYAAAAAAAAAHSPYSHPHQQLSAAAYAPQSISNYATIGHRAMPTGAYHHHHPHMTAGYHHHHPHHLF